jgi:hypothetical protein
MPRKYLTSIDLTKNELQNAAIQNLATAPGSPATGQIYFDTALVTFRVWSGAAWLSIDVPGANTVTSAMIVDGTIVNADINSAAAIALSKLATDPLARANHTGTQLAATVSDFDTQVRTSRLDQMAAPTVDLSANSHKITNLTNGAAASDAVNKGQLDGAVNGLKWTTPVEVAAVANSAITGLLTIDGITLAAGDRVLLTAQTTPAQQGLWVAASGAWARPVDYASGASVEDTAVYVAQGTVYGKSQWAQSNTAAIVVDTGTPTFVQTNGLGDITVLAPIVKTGNQLSLSNVPAKFSVDVGDGVSTSITITHNLNSKDVVVALYDKTTPFTELYPEVQRNGVNTVILIFAVAPTASQYRVVCVG